MTRHRSLVALVIALGLAARAAAAVALGNSIHFPDEAPYVDAARGLLTGHGFGEDYTRVPAYPVLLAALAAALPGSPDVLFLRVAQAAVTALGSAFVYILSVRAFGRIAALAAASSTHLIR